MGLSPRSTISMSEAFGAESGRSSCGDDPFLIPTQLPAFNLTCILASCGAGPRDLLLSFPLKTSVTPLWPSLVHRDTRNADAVDKRSPILDQSPHAQQLPLPKGKRHDCKTVWEQFVTQSQACQGWWDSTPPPSSTRQLCQGTC